MKQKVTFKKNDKYDIILYSIVAGAVLLLIFFLGFIEGESLSYLGFVLLIRVVDALCYLPLSVEVDEQCLYINRALKTKTIPLSAIRTIRLYPNPDADESILFRSRNGVLGSWGYYDGYGVGRYFAYYGCVDDCFLIELDNGKKYVLGCENANLMVDHISSLLN